MLIENLGVRGRSFESISQHFFVSDQHLHIPKQEA